MTLTNDEALSWTAQQIELSGYFDRTALRAAFRWNLASAVLATFLALPQPERIEIALRFHALGGNRDETD